MRELFPPKWNPKKEILLGTQERVNPTNTIARRTALISIRLGEKSPLYFALLDRFHPNKTEGKWCTRWRIADMVQLIGKSDKTIRRWLSFLDREGWLRKKYNKYKGSNTYCTYFMLPVNDLIGDYGTTERTTQKIAECPVTDDRAYAVTDDRIKRALKDVEKLQVSPSVSPSSSSQPLVAKQAEAGRGEAPPTAHFVATREERMIAPSTQKSVISWCLENTPFLVTQGFQERSPLSVARDIDSWLMKYPNPEDTWNLFVEEVWPLLKIKLPSCEFFKKPHKLGIGWIFTDNRDEPNEAWFVTILFSTRYGGFNFPKHIWQVGAIVSLPGYCIPEARIVSIKKTGYSVRSTNGGTDDVFNIHWNEARDVFQNSETTDCDEASTKYGDELVPA